MEAAEGKAEKAAGTAGGKAVGKAAGEGRLIGVEGKAAVQTTLGVKDKAELLRLSEISLWVDHYGEIFSDFDPRPYSERAVSDDFLNEAKKVSREKAAGNLELKFLVPAAKRNLKDEAVIKKRLRAHFKRQFELLEKEKKDILKKGLFLAAVGVLVMFVATLILFDFPEKSLLASFLVVILEPAGWFLFWEGLAPVFFEAKKQGQEREFYRKMAKCDILFISY